MCRSTRRSAGHEFKLPSRTGVGPARNSPLTSRPPQPRPGACALCHTISLPNVSRQSVERKIGRAEMRAKLHRARGSVPHEIKHSSRMRVGTARKSPLTSRPPRPRPGACALCHTISLSNVSRQSVERKGSRLDMSSNFHRGRGSVPHEIAHLPAGPPDQGQVLVHYVTPLAYRTFPGKVSSEKVLSCAGAQTVIADGGRSRTKKSTYLQAPPTKARCLCTMSHH